MASAIQNCSKTTFGSALVSQPRPTIDGVQLLTQKDSVSCPPTWLELTLPQTRQGVHIEHALGKVL